MRCALGFALLLSLAAGAAEPVVQEQVIQIVAKRFDFTPATIELKAGVPVVLELSTADRKHGFQVPDLHIDEEIVPGKTTRVRLVPERAGRFEFHCSVFCGGGHEEMTGVLVVSP